MKRNEILSLSPKELEKFFTEIASKAKTSTENYAVRNDMMHCINKKLLGSEFKFDSYNHHCREAWGGIHPIQIDIKFGVKKNKNDAKYVADKVIVKVFYRLSYSKFILADNDGKITRDDSVRFAMSDRINEIYLEKNKPIAKQISLENLIVLADAQNNKKFCELILSDMKEPLSDMVFSGPFKSYTVESMLKKIKNQVPVKYRDMTKAAQSFDDISDILKEIIQLANPGLLEETMENIFSKRHNILK